MHKQLIEEFFRNVDAGSSTRSEPRPDQPRQAVFFILEM
jgi:hypothetical protein